MNESNNNSKVGSNDINTSLINNKNGDDNDDDLRTNHCTITNGNFNDNCSQIKNNCKNIKTNYNYYHLEIISNSELNNSIIQRSSSNNDGIKYANENNNNNGNLSKLNCMDCGDYTIELECMQGPQDLQLAAELGKTLLERNKELETTLKHHQNVIDDQAQEIEYLQKQTAALREVNDSRLRIYEQLEVGIQDLERANHRLIVENTTDKKHIKSLQTNIENLEAKCEELSRGLEETRVALLAEKRKNERLSNERLSTNGDGKDTKRIRKFGNQLSENDEFSCDDIQSNNETDNECSFEFLSAKNSDFCSRNANSTVIGENSFINESTSTTTQKSSNSANADATNLINVEENEEVIRIVTELETTKKALISEQQKVAELEDQLVTIIQENQSLQSRIAQTSTNEEMKSVHDELSILDEVRQGTMCSRCLRSVDDKNNVPDDNLSILETEEDDDRSMSDVINNAESTAPIYRSAVTIKTSPPKPNTLDLNQISSSSSSVNPYRELVEKYEALLEVQRHSINRNSINIRQQNILLVSDDIQTSGEFSSINTKASFDEGSSTNNSSQDKDHNTTLTNNNNKESGDINSSDNNQSLKTTTINATRKLNQSSTSAQIHHKNNYRRTPTDFSEAETSSSGFSDEISHKATQTDERQGYFLCSIGDGEDCKFSIYDDASPIDSRFRNRPEYRELFKEIFAVLKKAAENKEEGESLPLLDDTHPNKVPPVTPANEDPPSFCDDTQSVISSAFSEQSIAMSECITKIERKTAKKHLTEKIQDNKTQLRPASTTSQPSNTATNETHIIENGKVLTPLKREPLEYVQVGVGIKKKNRKKHRNLNLDRSDSPVLPSPPRIYYSSGKKRRDLRPYIPSSPTSSNVTPKSHEWSGHSMVIYNRNMQSPSPSQYNLNTTNNIRKLDNSELNLSNMEYKPSTVSQDLHKLKKLDLSYAEVLRRADACKHHHRKTK